jgi:hypothetical protein
MNKTIPALITLTLLAGCSHRDQESRWQDPFFRTEGQASPVRAMLDAQSSEGSLADGTLHRQHFGQNDLNSLGRVKLDRMIAAVDTGEVMTVFLDLRSSPEAATPRVAQVEQYLLDQGLDVTAFDIRIGANLATSVRAADAIQALKSPTSTPAPTTAAMSPTPIN